MSTELKNKGPLTGVRILDLSTMIAAPYGRIARVPKGSPPGTASSPIWTSVIGSAVAEGLVVPVRFVLTAGGDDLVAHFVHDRRAVLGHRGNGDRLGVRAAAVVGGHDAAVVGGVLVRAHTEDLPQLPGQRDVEPAGGALRGRGHRDGGAGPADAVVPAGGGPVAALLRQHPDAPEPRLPQRLPVAVLLDLGVAGSEPDVVGRGRQQVAGAEVAGTQPLQPRHPLRGEQGVLARQQDALADGHDLGARRPRHGDGPAPPLVGGVEALEVVRDHAVALGAETEMLADGLGSRGLLRGLTGEVDRLGAGGVDRGRARPASRPGGGTSGGGADGGTRGGGLTRWAHAPILAYGTAWPDPRPDARPDARPVRAAVRRRRSMGGTAV